jgi:hypothetical protein
MVPTHWRPNRLLAFTTKSGQSQTTPVLLAENGEIFTAQGFRSRIERGVTTPWFVTHTVRGPIVMYRGDVVAAILMPLPSNYRDNPTQRKRRKKKARKAKRRKKATRSHAKPRRVKRRKKARRRRA